LENHRVDRFRRSRAGICVENGETSATANAGDLSANRLIDNARRVREFEGEPMLQDITKKVVTPTQQRATANYLQVKHGSTAWFKSG
jgi:hypothetical protein